MLGMPQHKVELLGMSYYFTRKGIQTSYDVEIPDSGSTITNPLPFIQNVFGALQASDDQHAYSTLNELRKLMAGAHNRERQLIVMLALGEVLPKLTESYRSELAELQSEHGKSSYDFHKKRLEEKHRGNLDTFIDYVRHAIHIKLTPSPDDFKNYLASLNGAQKERITPEYVLQVLEELRKVTGEKKFTQEEIYRRAVERIISKGVPVAGLQYLSTARRDEAEIRVHFGNDGKDFSSFRLNKERADIDVYAILMGIGRAILPNIPRSSPYLKTTIETIERLQKYVRPR